MKQNEKQKLLSSKVTYVGSMTTVIGVILYVMGWIFNSDHSDKRPELNFEITSLLLIAIGVIIFVVGKIKEYKEKKYWKEVQK